MFTVSEPPPVLMSSCTSIGAEMTVTVSLPVPVVMPTVVMPLNITTACPFCPGELMLSEKYPGAPWLCSGGAKIDLAMAVIAFG